MKYGLPYKGSKNKLAERIVSLLPKRTHLIDLFCGGCAVSHAALLRNKYEHIHINDINWICPTLFIDALNGKYQNETRWISRENFFRLKDTDPYVAVVWSFGNNLRDYLYSKEIEPLKKAIHYAIFFHDYSLGKEIGYDLSFIEPISDIQRRYAAVKRYFSQLVTSGNNHLRGGQIASVRLETIERLTNVRQNFNTKNPAAESAGFKKKKNRQGELCSGERANCIAQIAIPRATTIPAEKFGGGNFQTSHQVCLITPR